MSLKVWLPLDGDLRNLGASNEDFSIKTALTYTDNGKIGKACSGGTITIDANTTASILNNQEFSFTCWVYINSTEGSTSNRGMFFGNSNMGANNNRKFSIFQSPTCNDLHLSWMNDTASSVFIGTVWNGVFPSYKWTHVAVTYKNPNGTIYINGIKYATWSGISNSSSFEYETYLFQNAPNQTRYLNDYRIYNHCLSAAEVHEISQGLILHYKLDGFNSNLIWNSNWQQGSQNWSGWGTPPTREIVQIDGKNWLHVISNTSKYQGYSQNWNNRNNTDNITQNTQVTVSYTAFSNTSATFRHIGFHWNDENGNIISQAWFSPTLTITPTRYSFTTTTPSNCVKFNIMVGDVEDTAHEIWITDIKLEVGSAATIWTPNENDPLGKIFSIDNNIVQDSSGYGHNGVLVDGTYATKSPRYDTNIKLFGTTVNNTSNILTGAQYFYGHLPLSEISALTVSWWGKNTQYGRGGIFETTASTADNLVTGSGTYDYSTTAIANWDSTFRVYNGNNAINFFSYFSTNDSNWHYNTIVFDGSTAKYYKDGELKHNGALSGTLPAITGFRMGIGRAGGVYRQIKQEVSDLRIYVTPLLDNDIKMLYNVGMKVDNLQNLHTFNYVENEDSGTKTLTGDIITVEDAASKQLENLVINISSTQSGSGDPSPDNVRPISGWDGVKVTRCGKNLGQISDSTMGSHQRGDVQYSDSGVTVTSMGNYCRVGYLFSVKAGQRYRLSYKARGAGFNRIYYGELDGAWGTGNPGFWVYRTIREEEASYQYGFTATDSGLFFFGIYVSTTNYEGDYIQVSDFQLELGSTATEYEPYQGDTYDIAFPAEAGTVYGGTLDVTTGLLTVDWGMVDLGTLNWTVEAAGGAHPNWNNFYAAAPNAKGNFAAYGTTQICSHYANQTAATWNDKTCRFGYSSTNINISDSALSSYTAAQFKAAMSGIQLAYKLATPVTYQLSPSFITLLTGKNNIFADTGDISLEYSYYLPKSQKLTETGQLIANNFNENKKTSLYKSGFVEANNLIEI